MTDEIGQQIANSTNPTNSTELVEYEDVTLLHIRKKLLGLAPLAVETLRQAMDNSAPSNAMAGQTAVSAAKTVLDRIGIIPPKATDPKVRKSLEDMSRDELHAMIQAMEGELGARATPIAPAAEPEPSVIFD